MSTGALGAHRELIYENVRRRNGLYKKQLEFFCPSTGSNRFRVKMSRFYEHYHHVCALFTLMRQTLSQCVFMSLIVTVNIDGR